MQLTHDYQYIYLHIYTVWEIRTFFIFSLFCAMLFSCPTCWPASQVPSQAQESQSRLQIPNRYKVHVSRSKKGPRSKVQGQHSNSFLALLAFPICSHSLGLKSETVFLSFVVTLPALLFPWSACHELCAWVLP